MKLIGCFFVALAAGIFTACAADVLPDSLRFDAQGEMTLGPMADLSSTLRPRMGGQ